MTIFRITSILASSFLLITTNTMAESQKMEISTELQTLHNRSLVDALTAKIHTQKELYIYISNTPPEKSPLNKLNQENLSLFINSLVFSEAGLSSFNRSYLENLRTEDAYNILKLFGLGHDVTLIRNLKSTSHLDKVISKQYSPLINCAFPYAKGDETLVRPCDDQVGKRCAGNHTCVQSADDICTANC